ncbi:MAG: universal stress protein [Rhizobiales bacterium]|nr:universal stress protein [Hyphomicrobiales bacterium]
MKQSQDHDDYLHLTHIKIRLHSMCDPLRSKREVVFMFEKIVVGVDGSEQSMNALAIASDLAQKYASKLYLVHSPELESTGIAVGSGAVLIEPEPEAVAEAGEKVMQAAKKKAEELGLPPTECIIGNDDPAHEILKCTEKVGADLIVLGRRGLGGISSLLLGSVSQKVSHDAKCACLTVSH